MPKQTLFVYFICVLSSFLNVFLFSPFPLLFFFLFFLHPFFNKQLKKKIMLYIAFTSYHLWINLNYNILAYLISRMYAPARSDTKLQKYIPKKIIFIALFGPV